MRSQPNKKIKVTKRPLPVIIFVSIFLLRKLLFTSTNVVVLRQDITFSYFGQLFEANEYICRYQIMVKIQGDIKKTRKD